MIILLMQSDKKPRREGDKEKALQGKSDRGAAQTRDTTPGRAQDRTGPDRKTAHRAAACPDRYPVMPASR
ncbi:hypothetical protein, partial [Dickeya dadantii]